MRISFLIVSYLSLIGLSCQKHSCQIDLLEVAPQASYTSDTLLVNGHYHPQTCRTFFDARKTEIDILLHDDTTEPKDCEDESLPFQIHTFLFPSEKENYRGLRIEGRYPFSTENFQLATPAYPDFQQHALHLYSFSTPGKYILQIFFSEHQWQTFISSAERLTFTFQVTNTHPVPPTTKFTLLQGHYDPTTDLVNFQNLPDLSLLHPFGFDWSYADSVSSSVRIRSIYHLLTEDFALWNDDHNCRPLQNWDLSLIPATGYNLVEIKIDPPFLECLKQGETFNFRMALLR